MVGGMNPMLVPGLAVLGVVALTGILRWFADKGNLGGNVISALSPIVSGLLAYAVGRGVDLTPVLPLLVLVAPAGLFSSVKGLSKIRN